MTVRDKASDALYQSLFTPEGQRDPEAVVRTWATTLRTLGMDANNILEALKTTLANSRLGVPRETQFRLELLVQSMVGGR